jgi:hypothetical protein
MEELRTEFVENENREIQIKHWEVQLSDANHAVYVAQIALEKLYRQRYKVVRSMGATAASNLEVDCHTEE